MSRIITALFFVAFCFLVLPKAFADWVAGQDGLWETRTTLDTVGVDGDSFNVTPHDNSPPSIIPPCGAAPLYKDFATANAKYFYANAVGAHLTNHRVLIQTRCPASLSQGRLELIQIQLRYD